MAEPRLTFIDGLLWYLQTRNWAFEKIKTCPTGSHLLDIKMYHYLYFSNLFGAVDIIRDNLKPTGKDAAFEDQVKRGFGNTTDWQYARELRNSIVHRGIDPAAAGHANGNIILVLCPATVQDQKGKKSYSCTFKYLVELAECCNRAVNPAIFEVLESHGLLEPGQMTVGKETTLSAIKDAEVMPEWAKTMALKALGEMDFIKMAEQIASTRINELKGLLGH